MCEKIIQKMRDTRTNSPMRRGLEMIRESFAPRRRSTSMSDIPSQEEWVELSEICSLGEGEEHEQEYEDEESSRVFQLPKWYTTALGGGGPRQQRQTNGGAYARSRMASPVTTRRVTTPDATMKVDTLGPGVSRVSSAPINWKPEMAWGYNGEGYGYGLSPAVDISQKDALDLEGLRSLRKHKQRSVSSVESRDEAREEAWERRSNRILLEEMHEMQEDKKARIVGRSVSDCGDRAWPRPPTTRRQRARSLTDEDMDELRGCIDLGFGFSNEDPKLCSTLPALELCYAIAKQYHDVPGRSSPVSILDGGDSLERSGSGRSFQSSPMESWRIASPGKSNRSISLVITNYPCLLDIFVVHKTP